MRAVSANAVPIGFERVDGLVTGPCHRSAAKPAAKPLPRATKAPRTLERVFSFAASFAEERDSAIAHASETTSVRALSTTPRFVRTVNGGPSETSTFVTGSSRG